MTTPTLLTPYQRILAHTYDGGEFAHLLLDEGHWRDALPMLGDTLLSFLMLELSHGEGCEDDATAVKRLDTAIGQIQQVRDAIARRDAAGRTAVDAWLVGLEGYDQLLVSLADTAEQAILQTVASLDIAEDQFEADDWQRFWCEATAQRISYHEGDVVHPFDGPPDGQEDR